MCSQFPWSWSYSFYGKSVIFRKCLSCLSGADNEAESDIFVGKKCFFFQNPRKCLSGEELSDALPVTNLSTLLTGYFAELKP